MCSKFFLKIINFFLTACCCLLIIMLIIGLVGCIMMGLYSIGSLLFTDHLNTMTAFYVSADTAFILGGGLAVIAVLFYYSDIQNYISSCTDCDDNNDPLSRIASDPEDHSTISIEDSQLTKTIKDNKAFACPICLDTMLAQTPINSQPEGTHPFTIRYVIEDKTSSNEQKKRDNSHDEQTYHKDCIASWFAGGNETEPSINENIFHPSSPGNTFFKYTGYNTRQREEWRQIQKNLQSKLNKHSTDENIRQHQM